MNLTVELMLMVQFCKIAPSNHFECLLHLIGVVHHILGTLYSNGTMLDDAFGQFGQCFGRFVVLVVLIILPRSRFKVHLYCRCSYTRLGNNFLCLHGEGQRCSA